MAERDQAIAVQKNVESHDESMLAANVRHMEIRKTNSLLQDQMTELTREYEERLAHLEVELRETRSFDVIQGSVIFTDCSEFSAGRSENHDQAQFITALQDALQEKEAIALEVQDQAEQAVEEAVRLRKLVAMQQDEMDERTRGLIRSRPASRSSIANMASLAHELEGLQSPHQIVSPSRRSVYSPLSRHVSRNASRASITHTHHTPLPPQSPTMMTSPLAQITELKQDAQCMERQLEKQNEKMELLIRENQMLRDGQRPQSSTPKAATPTPTTDRKQSKVTIRVKRDVATYAHGVGGEVHLLDATDEHVSFS